MGLVEKKPDHFKIGDASECQLRKDAEGVRICAIHEKPLKQLTTTGAGARKIHTWKCLESGQTFMEIEGF